MVLLVLSLSHSSLTEPRAGLFDIPWAQHTDREVVNHLRCTCAVDGLVAPHAVARQLLAAHLFVHQVVEERERVLRLLDPTCAERREARFRIALQRELLRLALIVVTKLLLHCSCRRHHRHVAAQSRK